MSNPLRSTLTAMLLRSAQSLAPLCGAAALGLPAVSVAAELNVVKNLDVSAAGQETVVAIAGSKAPVFTVFRLDGPPRVVVDLAGADLSAVQGTVAGQGAVKQVSASQFSDGKASVARVVIALNERAKYDVRSAGDKVLIRVAEGDLAPLPETRSEAPAAKSHGDASQPAEAKAEPKVEPKAAPAEAKVAAAPSAEGADPHLVVSRVDERAVAQPATKVTGAKVSKKGAATRLDVHTDGEVGTYALTELRDPARLAIDLKGVHSAAKLHVDAQGPVRDVRTGKREDGLRLVIDADALAEGSYKIERTKHGLAVVFGAQPAKVEVAQVESPAPAPVPASIAAPAAVAAKATVVKDVSFKGDENVASVLVGVPTTSSYELSRPDAHTAVLTLHHAELAKSMERSLDTSAFGGPVKMVSSFTAQNGSGDVQIVATLDAEAKDEVKPNGKGGLKWVFTASDDSEMSIDGVHIDLGNTRTAGLQAEGPAYAQSGAPRKPRYTGRRVSFEFKDIDLHNLLRIISEVAKKNIIVADDVSGKVTIRLRNVPWDQALDVILKSKGLDKDESGNIIRIMRADVLANERKLAAEQREKSLETEEPKLRLIPVNYANASEVQDRVKDILTKKGTVTVDRRTNVLIVKDVVASLARVEGLVRNLDLQTPQVLIEARIIEASSTFAHDLGVQWGGNITFAPALGNPTGLIFPNTAVVTGGVSPNTQLPGLNATPNFAVDLPAAVGTGKGGGIGFIFGSAGGAAALNLRISALEGGGSAKTISAPKVTTLDNETATISQGVAIPFSQFSASGVNTAFIEAKLELKVTPHVTQDGSVVLKIDATNNQPNPGFTGSNGQPSITKKEAHTQVLVKDGDTTVIGGIYTRANGASEDIVPIFGRIPVLGWFFRHRSENDTRTELLIFVTPHIVNRQQAVAAASGAAPAPANP